MIATVIDTKDVPVGTQCPTLAGFVGEDAHDRAAEFIGTLPEAETGRYGLDVSPGSRLSVQTRDLQPGDVLVPTLACFLGSEGINGKVYPRASSGTRTPPGKLDVLLRHPKGRTRTATWGRYTKLTIIRHTSEEA